MMKSAVTGGTRLAASILVMGTPFSMSTQSSVVFQRDTAIQSLPVVRVA